MTTDAGYLLDTNVIVALIRNNDLGRHIDASFALSQDLHRSAISVVTVGEMYSLAAQFGWGEQKQSELASILDEIVWIDINNDKVIRAYGAIDAAGVKNGWSMGKNDVWIAATASASGMTLLTADRDFDFAHPRFLRRVWIDPASVPTAQSAVRATTTTGYENRNGQVNLGPLGIPGTDHNQMLYRMRCRHCAHEYAANGSDIHHRRCPECQGGQPSSGGWLPG